MPGDTLNYFTDAVRRSSLRWVHMRHEEAGAMAAGADALLTGELALCAGSCGPGSLHFINGVWDSAKAILAGRSEDVLDLAKGAIKP